MWCANVQPVMSVAPPQTTHVSNEISNREWGLGLLTTFIDRMLHGLVLAACKVCKETAVCGGSSFKLSI